MYHLKRFDQRIASIIIILLCAFSLIVARLFYIQIIHGDYYHLRSEQNFLRIEPELPARGTIFDCHHTILVTNRPTYNLLWNGTGNRTLTNQQRAILHHIEQICGQSICNGLVSPSSSLTITEKNYRYQKIASDITLEQLSKITEHYPNNPNLIVKTEFQRYYPHGSLASHIIGYLHTSADTIAYGQMGIEKACNDLLKGEKGTFLKTINSYGRTITNLQQEKVHHGSNIYTTIDIRLQKIIELIFPPTRKGSIIVMDPNNGAIKAMASYPQFDPSLFLQSIGTATWHQLQEKKPFFNRTLNSYPPGSIFKLVTISAALEHGYLSPKQRWHCHGYTHFADRKYWCHRRYGHRTLSTLQAIAQSCNVPFYEIGKQIDIDLLNQYAHIFGLGMPTGFLFHENAGIIPSRAWKMHHHGNRWWQGETLSVAIGQSFLMTTPLQIARMISSIFTGYLVKPRILENEAIEKIPLAIKPTTLAFLKKAMRFVVTHGTGKGINTFSDSEVYAKTSTAQVTDFKKRKLSEQFLEHAWFVSYFQYKKYEPLVLLILVENAGTSQVATSIAKEFIVHYKEIAKSL